jgi:predicted transcriptional regulator of viral defense system
MTMFLETHPVFRIGELRKHFSLSDKSKEVSNILSYNKRMGWIGVVKSGLYYAIRPGKTETTMHVDPLLVAAKMRNDAVLAFHSALEFLGFSHSVLNSYYYYSAQSHPVMRFRNDHFCGVQIPRTIRKKSLIMFGTEKFERSGINVVVTGKERTLVDVLERPQLCGGVEEIFRSLEKMPYIQPELVLKYLTLRRKKILFARVGFFLEQHREQFQIEESFLRKLEINKPVQPLYWERSCRGGVIKNRWNLIVPEAIDQRKWKRG